MIKSLANIMSDFGGEANRARCLSHIVNLVVKIILHQFDIPKKKPKKDLLAANNLESYGPDMASGNDHDVDEAEEEFEELARVLDKEEKEMDEADNEESNTLERDVEKIEEAIKEEIKGVSKIVKPVCQVLFKVSTLGPESLDPLVLGLLAFFFFCLPFFYSWWR